MVVEYIRYSVPAERAGRFSKPTSARGETAYFAHWSKQ